MAAEVSIEAKLPDPIKDLEERLVRLKGNAGNTGSYASPSDDSNSHLSSFDQEEMNFDEVF